MPQPSHIQPFISGLILPLFFLVLLILLTAGYAWGQKIVNVRPSASDKAMLVNGLILALSGTAALLAYGTLTGLLVSLLMLGLSICLGSDYADYTLPDRCTFGLTALGLIASTIDHNIIFSGGLLNSLIGGAVGFAMMYALSKIAQAIYGREAVGGGDIKLMAAVGTWFGWSAPIFVLVAGAVFGLLISISSRFRNQEGPAQVPFGPPMIYSMIVWIFGGYKLMDMFVGRVKIITEALGI